MHILVMYEYISMIRFIEWSKLRDNAFNSLHAVTCFACIIYGLGFFYTVWLKKEMFVKVFKQIETIEFFDGEDKWIGWKVWRKSIIETLKSYIQIFPIQYSCT
jgi:hypothetical protein